MLLHTPSMPKLRAMQPLNGPWTAPIYPSHYTHNDTDIAADFEHNRRQFDMTGPPECDYDFNSFQGFA